MFLLFLPVHNYIKGKKLYSTSWRNTEKAVGVTEQFNHRFIINGEVIRRLGRSGMVSYLVQSMLNSTGFMWADDTLLERPIAFFSATMLNECLLQFWEDVRSGEIGNWSRPAHSDTRPRCFPVEGSLTASEQFCPSSMAHKTFHHELCLIVPHVEIVFPGRYYQEVTAFTNRLWWDSNSAFLVRMLAYNPIGYALLCTTRHTLKHISVR